MLRRARKRVWKMVNSLMRELDVSAGGRLLLGRFASNVGEPFFKRIKEGGDQKDL